MLENCSSCYSYVTTFFVGTKKVVLNFIRVIINYNNMIYVICGSVISEHNIVYFDGN